jgi:hypothetical protein
MQSRFGSGRWAKGRTNSVRPRQISNDSPTELIVYFPCWSCGTITCTDAVPVPAGFVPLIVMV